MPWLFLSAYIQGLPGLEASDALHWSTIALVGSGNLKKEQHGRIIREWQRAARRGQQRPDRPKGPMDVMSRMAALGIQTEVIAKHD